MKKYKETEIRKYVFAYFSQTNNYLYSLKNAKYCFIDNIVSCTKFINYKTAKEIRDECIRNFKIDLVVAPIMITYEIIEE